MKVAPKKSGLTRRDMFKGAGVAALGFGLLQLAPSTTEAQVSATDASNTVYYRFKLGDADMIVVSDATFGLPAANLGANQPAEDVLAFFDSLHILTPNDTVNITVLNLVMMVDDTIALFDTGNGGANGRLQRTLEALGIPSDSVTDVIISHLHGDHINGLSNEGALTYSNAQVHFPQPEFDYMESAPSDTGGAWAKLQPAIDADQVSFYGDGDEIIAGVQGIAAHGHTPGHMALLISSGDAQLLHVVDSVFNALSSLPHPDWHIGFDADGEMAVEARTMLINMASEQGLQVMGYHYPFPGLGYIAAVNDSHQWIPAAF